MNVDVIRKAVDVAPERMDMRTWKKVRSCGTLACIAGNCLMQNDIPFVVTPSSYDLIAGAAASVMDITIEQAERLFYVDNWPACFVVRDAWGEGDVCDAEEYILDPGTPEYLARVRERVELFIATNGAE